MRLGKNFLKMKPLYELFGREFTGVTFTQEDLEAAYKLETFGSGSNGGLFLETNGYVVGKKFLNLQVTSWKEDILAGYLHLWELYEDPQYWDYHWWLDSIFSDLKHRKHPVRPSYISPDYNKEYVIKKLLRGVL